MNIVHSIILCWFDGLDIKRFLLIAAVCHIYVWHIQLVPDVCWYT